MLNNKKNLIITVNREYGAGGRTVARALAEEFGIPWYDRDFVKLTAEKTGYASDEIKANSEELTVKSQLIDTIFGNASYTSAHDAVFKAQRRAMIELAMAGNSFILVGRCANFIYRDAGIDCFNVFLYADMDYRIKRAAELAENESMDLQKYIELRDSKRQNYYKHYTKSFLGNYKDYDLCVDVSKLGTSESIRLIAQAIKDYKENKGI